MDATSKIPIIHPETDFWAGSKETTADCNRMWYILHLLTLREAASASTSAVKNEYASGESE